MPQCQGAGDRQMGRGLGIAGVMVSICLGLDTGSSAVAQITPDRTLGAEPSVVSPVGNIRGLPGILIQGGARRGVNLFQSFSDFNVLAGQRVYFANPTGVESILSRVTGRTPSNIMGTLGVNGSANLFLINPNGIVFGPNARLDVAGSFVASTATRFNFGNGLSFSAVNPQSPPLLMVSLRPGLQYGTDYQGDITNAGSLAVGNGQTLVLAGKTVTSTGFLGTPGGTVQLLGAAIALRDNARIDVSGLGGGGTVQIGGDYQGQGTLPRSSDTFIGSNVVINADGISNLRPTPDPQPPAPANGGRVIIWSDGTTRFFGTVNARGGSVSGDGGFVEVSGKENLVFQGLVNASAANGRPGTLLLDPTNIEIVAGAGNGTLADVSDSGLPNRGSGGTQISNTLINNALQDVILQASNNITFSAPIEIAAAGVGLEAIAGNSIFVNNDISTTRGNIVLTAQQGDVRISNATLNSNPTETGVAGDVRISARNQVSLLNSSIFARSDAPEPGFSTVRLVSSQGGVALTTAFISATNFGDGFAGDVFLDAPSQISIFNSQIFSRGTFGRILLGVSNSDELTNRLSTPLPATIGIFNSVLSANNSDTNRGRIGVFGGNQVTIADSSLTSQSTNTDTDNFSRIEIFARSGSVLLKKATISTTNNDIGFAGDVIISATQRLDIGDDTNIFSRGNQGRILVGQSNDINNTYPGFSPQTILISNSSLNTNNGSVTGGTANINAGRVLVRSAGSITATAGSEISSSTERQGEAGAVSILAPGNITLEDSRVFSNVERNGIGDAGIIRVLGRSIFLFNGAQIQSLVRGPDDTRPAGRGNAGAVAVVAPETVKVIGRNIQGFPSAIFTSVSDGASGDGGIVFVQTRSLQLRDRGKIDANNFGTGIAGDVLISAVGIWVDNRSLITASSQLGRGGNVLLNVPGAVILGRSSDISTEAVASRRFDDRAGNIAIGTGFVFDNQAGRLIAPQFSDRTLLIAGKTFNNNDIFAGGEASDGGAIRINASQLQQIVQRPLNNRTNDISAQSFTGASGEVVISAVNIFPSFRADPLPEKYTPPRISQGCDPRVRRETSQFNITGRGGLPADPTEVLSPATLSGGSSSTASVPASGSDSAGAIVPARGWVQQSDGGVRLVAYTTASNAPVPNLVFPIPGSCNAP